MRTVLMYIMPILMLVLMVAIIFYLSRRISWSFGFNRGVTITVVAVVIVASMASMMAIMWGNYTSTFSHIVSNTANIIIGVVMFAACVTLLLDVVNIFIKIQPRMFGYLLIGATTMLSVYSLWNASNTKVYHSEIKLPNLIEPLRIAHVSDTHFGHFWGEHKAQKLADLIKKEGVDAIIITGDMFDGRVRLNSDVVRPFTEIGVPIYFSEGNHDGYSGSGDIKRLLEDNGVTVLSNEKADFKGLQIVGLDYLLPDRESADNFHGSTSNLTMQSVLPKLNIDPSRASILLHHNPVGAEYAASNGINLYLAGHTHAGQLFPATLVAKAMFEYNKGLYRYDDNMQIYVSQGTGTFGPPMRLGTESELTIIDLMR